MSDNCPIAGHDGNRAPSCRACRAEFLAEGAWPSGTRHHDARPAAALPREPDAHERAAGEREGDR